MIQTFITAILVPLILIGRRQLKNVPAAAVRDFFLDFSTDPSLMAHLMTYQGLK
jgi:hypothetical protein